MSSQGPGLNGNGEGRATVGLHDGGEEGLDRPVTSATHEERI